MNEPNLNLDRKKRKKTLLLSGVFFLAVANILGKIFGFFYKVPLNLLLGDEMANVNSAYAVYTTLYMISTAGIPVAVSLLISEEAAKGHRTAVQGIYRIATRALAVVGVLVGFLMLILAGPISRASSDGDAFLCMCAIAPALLFVSLSGVLRGYFQGHGWMRPTAISQVMESFGKLLFGLFFTLLALRVFSAPPSVAAAFAILGITVSIALGTLYLFAQKHRFDRVRPSALEWEREQETVSSGLDRRALVLRLFRIALPIALTSAVVSFSSLADAQLMRPLLERYTESFEEAKAIYSDYSTGAVTMFNLPLVLITPIACAIVPFLHDAMTRKDHAFARSMTDSALRMAALLALPCALGLSVLAAPILRIVFVGDADMATHAGGLLSVLALSVFPVGLLSVSNAVLQAYRHEWHPIFSMALGLAVKITVSVLLIPRIGAIGAPIGTFSFYATALLCDFVFLRRVCGAPSDILRIFFRPLPGALACAASALLAYRFLFARTASDALSVLCAILLACLVYLLFVILFRCITEEDLLLLPMGKKLQKYFQKFEKKHESDKMHKK